MGEKSVLNNNKKQQGILVTAVCTNVTVTGNGQHANMNVFHASIPGLADADASGGRLNQNAFYI